MVEDAPVPRPLTVALVAVENAVHYGEQCLTSALLDELYTVRTDANKFANTLAGSEDDSIPNRPSGPTLDLETIREMLDEATSRQSVESEELTEADYHEQASLLAHVKVELDVAARALSALHPGDNVPEEHGPTLGDLRADLDTVRKYVEDDFDTEAEELYRSRLETEQHDS